MFQKLDPLPSSGEGRKTSTLLGPLERANLNHWTICIQQLRLALSKELNRIISHIHNNEDIEYNSCTDYLYKVFNNAFPNTIFDHTAISEIEKKSLDPLNLKIHMDMMRFRLKFLI
jgi:hypothetical protein